MKDNGIRDITQVKDGKLELEVYNATLDFAQILQKRNSHLRYRVEMMRCPEGPATAISIKLDKEWEMGVTAPGSLYKFHGRDIFYINDSQLELNQEYITYLIINVPGFKKKYSNQST
jgi:hypothetical protein